MPPVVSGFLGFHCFMRQCVCWVASVMEEWVVKTVIRFAKLLHWLGFGKKGRVREGFLN